MGSNSFWRIVGLAVAVVIALAIVNWILKNLVGIIVAVAIVAAILYLILNATGRRRSF